MKIIADENMPYVETLFSDFGDIERVNGRELTPEQVSGADILLVRSITKVTPALLQHAKNLKFVGSATIGTDHVDVDYLAQRQIAFSNAPGCNATAVGQYAFIAMLELAKRFNQNLSDKVVGIVGAGNTGSAVEKCLRAYGVKVLLCDPIKQAQGDSREFVCLDELIAQADIVSLHVPLTREGEHKTWNLFDELKLGQLKQDAWLLNCCRGEVIDNHALINIKQQRHDLKLVLDVWEGEPQPMLELVELADIATPHIAGYSLEGKAKGTFMLYQKWCQLLGQGANKQLSDLLPRFFISGQQLSTDCLTTSERPVSTNQNQLLSLARIVYDIRDDDDKFRLVVTQQNGFDQMRKQHKHRREFSALSLGAAHNLENEFPPLQTAQATQAQQAQLQSLCDLGFHINANK